MLPVVASAPTPEPAPVPAPEQLLAAWREHQRVTGRGNPASDWAARTFLDRWPNPQDWADEPLQVRLSLPPSTMSLLMFLMVRRWLRPGWDWLVSRKLSSFWREIPGSPLEGDMTRFCDIAVAVGFSATQARRAASQSIGRVLIQTGRRLEDLTVVDLDALADACRARQATTGQGWRHYRSALVCAHTVLFHLDVVTEPPEPQQEPNTFEDRLADCHPNLRPAFVAYLERKLATCQPKTVSSLATRLTHFGLFLAEHRSRAGLAGRAGPAPTHRALPDLGRRRHLNHYGRADHRRRPGPPAFALLATFSTDITEWGWDDAPARRLIFRVDIPACRDRCPATCPSTPTGGSPRRSSSPTTGWPRTRCCCNAAAGCGSGSCSTSSSTAFTRSPGTAAWLKVPLGKLDTERMVPLDDETLALIDHITAIRSTGRPMPHPRYRRPAQFLFTHHGRRLSQTAVRARTRPRAPKPPGSTTSPRTSCGTPTPPPWSTPACPCRR